MLSLQSIFSSFDFIDEGFDRPRWNDSGSSYTTLKLTYGIGREIISHNLHDNSSKVFVSLEQLRPSDSLRPLFIEDYVISNDFKKVLIFTNSTKVWRLNTKGSYWILSFSEDSSSTSLLQLGLTLANPKVLMFATFNPSQSKVAYVYEHNIYLEDLTSHRISQLTHDGNQNIINGTFDWVYEEEFHMRNGYRFVYYYYISLLFIY